MSIASKQTEVKYLKTGRRGMLPYPAGEWTAEATYTATENVAPYVLRNGTYYVMNKVGSVKGLDPQTDYGTNGQQATWIPFEEYKAVYVELLMARLGLIGKSVFWDNYTFSQKGVDDKGQPSDQYQNFEAGTFTPNILIDWVEGKFRALEADIEGTIRSKVSYSPFVEVAASDIGQGGLLDPMKLGSNIILGNSLGGPSYVRLPTGAEYSGIVLRILEPFITRSNVLTALVASFPKTGGTEQYTTFTPTQNLLVELMAVPQVAGGSCVWYTTSLLVGTFSNDYR